MKVQLVHSIEELREKLAPPRRRELTIGCVPTMGALHAGHGRLIEQARQECDVVVITVFVNPIQFNQAKDFEGYPRTLATDLDFCEARGVDFVFAPEGREMYPAPLRTFVEVERLTDHLCGPFRPGHFRGVATVVAKLLMIVQPHRAYFGEKDAQQLAVISRMAQDLNIPVSIIEVPTVREADGLAISSRNQHLDARQRQIATVLYEALQAARNSVAAGARRAEEVKRAAMAVFAGQPEARLEYLEVVDAGEMQPVERIEAPVRVVAAAWVGNTRLIDNVLCEITAL